MIYFTIFLLMLIFCNISFSAVVCADIFASYGLFHIVDAVLEEDSTVPNAEAFVPVTGGAPFLCSFVQESEDD